MGQVVEVDPSSDARWDRFVLAQPSASGHHLAGWAGILRECYGYRPRYLALEEAGALVGVLPLVHGSRRLFGSRLSSLPTSKSAGPLALSVAGERELLRVAAEISLRESAGALIVRSEHAGLQGGSIGLGSPGRTYRLTPGDEDELLDRYRRGAKNLYRSILKAERARLSIGETRSAADLRDWYRLYLVTIRRHRSLPRRLRQFQASMSRLGSAWRFAVVKKHGRVVAGGVFHDVGDTVELVYSAMDSAYRSECPTHALYWRALRDAARRGQGFDFGVAGSEGLRAFKRRWGAEPAPIYLYTHRAESSPAGESGTPLCRARTAWTSHRASAAAESLGIEALGRLPLAVNRLAGTLAYRFA